MGAMKELLTENLESVMQDRIMEMNGDRVFIEQELLETMQLLIWGQRDELAQKELDYFATLHVDTADFISDWIHAIASAIALFTGTATTEDGMIGNSFDWMSYHFHIRPRGTVRAMQKMGLNDRAIQGIIYLLTGRLLDANNALNIVRFEYLDKQKHPEKTVMSRIV